MRVHRNGTKNVSGDDDIISCFCPLNVCRRIIDMWIICKFLNVDFSSYEEFLNKTELAVCIQLADVTFDSNSSWVVYQE